MKTPTKAQRVLRELNNKTSNKILNHIVSNEGCCVKDVYNELNIEQSVTSSHLNRLVKSNLVKKEKRGRNFLLYKNEKGFKELNNYISCYLK